MVFDHVFKHITDSVLQVVNHHHGVHCLTYTYVHDTAHIPTSPQQHTG